MRYQEWLTDQGLWDLSDPSLPTYITGSCLGKILPFPGQDIPEEWLHPPHSETSANHDILHPFEKPYYSATVFPEPWVADHHPLQIELSGKPETGGKIMKTKTLRIGNLEPMDWLTKDSQFCEYWESSRPKILNAIQ